MVYECMPLYVPGALAKACLVKCPVVTTSTKVTLKLPATQAYFRPELLNRLDEIVVFRQLAQRDARAITELVLADTQARLAKRGIGLEVTAALMRLVCETGYNQVRARGATRAPD